jgi:asparagine synthase (glutamine-hydrolysing)
MAGFYIFAGAPDPARLAAAVARLKFFDESVVALSEARFSAAWVGHDDPDLFAPALDPVSGVWVMTSGRVAFEEAEWGRHERTVQFEGGLANRVLLARYLEGGVAALARHNGPAALAVWDPREDALFLWSDHFGYHPIFGYRLEDAARFIVSSFPDAIAADDAAVVSRDPISAAEFLSAWRITPPHTYWKEIKYVGAATCRRWNVRSLSVDCETYWHPYQEQPFPSLGAAAEELAKAVGDAVRIRTHSRFGPIVSFTSGGLDSRVVLFSAASAGDVVGVNLYDVPNRESDVARRLCEAAGVRYVGFARDNDYYPRLIKRGTELSGAMWSQEDSHYLGTRELIAQLGARTVMTACTTDWLFKGYGLEKEYIRFAGRNLPIQRLTKTRIDAFLPNRPRPVPERYRQEVAGRMDECLSGTPRQLKSDRDWLLVEDRRIRPACYTVSVSGQIMYRVFPYDTFLGDSKVADCYSRARASWKVNADLWGRAAKLICERGEGIEDANFGWRIGSSVPAKLSAFAAGWIRRRLKPSLLGAGGLATEGSWPNFRWYVENSATLQDLWTSIPQPTRDCITEVWGEDPWRRPLREWGSCTNDLMRIVTLAAHLK